MLLQIKWEGGGGERKTSDTNGSRGRDGGMCLEEEEEEKVDGWTDRS